MRGPVWGRNWTRAGRRVVDETRRILVEADSLAVPPRMMNRGCLLGCAPPDIPPAQVKVVGGRNSIIDFDEGEVRFPGDGARVVRTAVSSEQSGARGRLIGRVVICHRAVFEGALSAAGWILIVPVKHHRRGDGGGLNTVLGGQKEGAPSLCSIVHQSPTTHESRAALFVRVPPDRADLIAPRVGLTTGDVQIAGSGLRGGASFRKRAVAVYDLSHGQVQRAAAVGRHDELNRDPLPTYQRRAVGAIGRIVPGVRPPDEVVVGVVDVERRSLREGEGREGKAERHRVLRPKLKAPEPLAGGQLLPRSVLGRPVAGLQDFPVAVRNDLLIVRVCAAGAHRRHVDGGEGGRWKGGGRLKGLRVLLGGKRGTILGNC